MSASARVMVVSHEATLTGAPRVAVEVVRALRDGGQVICVLRAGGPLTAAFEAVADTTHREPLARARAVLRRFGPLRSTVNRLDELVARFMLARERPTLVFLNTVKSACYVRPALRRGVPVVLHSHELGVLASSVLDRYPLGRRWHDVRLMACSDAARDTLAELTDVAPSDIKVVTSPVDVAAVAAAGADPAPHDHPTVGACGTVNERKGADLWLQVAQEVAAQRPDVRFRWIGARKTAWPDISGLDDVVEFAGQLAAPHPAIAALDVFTLPSREDAFPLVVLEAMALRRPVVAFDVGSVADQLGDTGVVVPPEDTAAMAKAVIDLLDDADKARALGDQAAARVAERYDVAAFHAAIRQAVA